MDGEWGRAGEVRKWGCGSGFAATIFKVERAGFRKRNQNRRICISNKGWVEHTEILLPKYAPESFKKRQHLWNQVEMAEKSANDPEQIRLLQENGLFYKA